MGRQTLTAPEQVQAFLSQYTGKTFKWCYRDLIDLQGGSTIAQGRTSDDQWFPYVTLDKLPTGRRLLLQMTDGKVGRFVNLPVVPRPMSGTVLQLNPALQAERDSLQKEREQLQDEWAALEVERLELLRREKMLLQEQRTVQDQHNTISKALDQRTFTHASALADRQRDLDESALEKAMLLKVVDEAYGRAASADEKNELTASVTFAIDRLFGVAEVLKAKKFSDFSADKHAEYSEFVQWKARRRFFNHMPGIERKFLADFTTMNGDQRKAIYDGIVSIYSDGQTPPADGEVPPDEKERNDAKP